MKKLFVFVIGIFLPLFAYAWQFEAGVGYNHFRDSGDGTWYQQGMPSSTKQDSPAVTLGVTGPLFARSSWGVDWHIDYVYLGRASASCICTSDQNYDSQAHREISVQDAPLSRFTGSGNAMGLEFALEPYYVYRGVRLAVNAGLFPYRPNWNETVYTMPSTPGEAPISLGTPHAIQLGKSVGASISWKQVTVAYKHYWLPTRADNAHPQSFMTGANLIEVMYRW